MNLFPQAVLNIFNQAAGTDTEQFLVQPVVAQYFFNDCIVFDSIFGGAYTSRYFYTDLLSCDGMVLFDHFTHRINGFRGCAGVTLACGCFDEICA